MHLTITTEPKKVRVYWRTTVASSDTLLYKHWWWKLCFVPFHLLFFHLSLSVGTVLYGRREGKDNCGQVNYTSTSQCHCFTYSFQSLYTIKISQWKSTIIKKASTYTTCKQTKVVPSSLKLFQMCMYMSVMCAWHVTRPLPVTAAQLIKPGIGRNTCCALSDIHLGLVLAETHPAH